jgi:hypothetical protein
MVKKLTKTGLGPKKAGVPGKDPKKAPSTPEEGGLTKKKTSKKGRVFYTRRKARESGSEEVAGPATSANGSADGNPEGEQGGSKRKRRANIGTKRAKMEFYQDCDNTVISFYTLRNNLKQHFEYLLKKYNLDKVLEQMDGISALSAELVPSKKTKSASDEAGGSPSHSSSAGKATRKASFPKRETGVPQISEEGLNICSAFIGKNLERILVQAKKYTTHREAQTTNSMDYYSALKDFEALQRGKR